MKIGFDARLISHPGMGRYIKNLLDFMFQQEKQENFVLFGKPEELLRFPTTKVINYQQQIYRWKEIFFAPFAKYEIDLLHVPHFNAPLKKKNPLVITIHDLIYLKITNSAPAYKRFAAKRIISNAVKNADKIIAVSQNTKNDLINLYPKTKEKISVIYEAADPIFKKITNQQTLEATKILFGLPEKYILFVGSLKKHKNIEGLIYACNQLKAKGLKHLLVITGRFHRQESQILEKIKACGALYLGEVTDDELVKIYNLADLLVLPSFYEGFGLPVLEAMACQTPVIASNISSLPEIIENSKFLFDPKNNDEIAQKIYLILTDASVRNECIQNGQRITAKFNWENTAKKTLNIYQELINNEKVS